MTVVCAEQEYTAGVADTIAVANAVLISEQMELVNNGETIEIRIDVKDISDQVPERDKEVIENGIEEYRKEVPGLVLGMYVDISMYMRIGSGDWNAIHATRCRRKLERKQRQNAASAISARHFWESVTLYGWQL